MLIASYFSGLMHGLVICIGIITMVCFGLLTILILRFVLFIFSLLIRLMSLGIPRKQEEIKEEPKRYGRSIFEDTRQK